MEYRLTSCLMSGSQVDDGRDDVQPVADPLDALADRHPVLPQNVNNRPLHLQRLQAHADRQAGLAVQVNQENPLSLRRQSHAEIVRCRGLSHAALLVRYRYNLQILHSLFQLYSLRLLFKLYKIYLLFLILSSKKRCLQAWRHRFLFHIHLLYMIYTLILLYILYLHKQSNGANIAKSRR